MRSEAMALDVGAVGLAETARGDLLALAGRLDAQLLPVGEALLLLVQTVDAVVQGLASVRAALADGATERAIEDVLRASAALLEAPERQDRQRTRFMDLREKVKTLNNLSRALDRVLLMLEFYCVNMKIAASGADDFVDFADEMRAQLATGRLHLADFGSTVARLFEGFDTMVAVDRDFLEESKRLIPAVPEELAAAAQRLRQQQATVAATVAAGEQSARRIHSKVSAALGAIQIADNVRQRIEHAAFICERMAEAAALDEPQRSETEGQLAALAIAQLEAVGRDFAEDAGCLLESLEGLLPDTHHLLESIRNDTSIPESAALVARFGEGIDHSARLTAKLQQTNREAAEILQTVLTAIGDLSGRVERVRDLGVEVGYMSVNANLRSRRDQGISKAVSVIAIEIKVQSTIIDEVSGRFVGVAGEMGEVAAAIGRGEDGGPVDVASLLAAAHTALLAATEQSREGVAQIGADCSAITGRLPATIAQVRESLALAAGIDAICALLATAARRAEPEVGANAAHPLHAMLARIAAIYSMAIERIIHADVGLAGTELGSPPMPPPAACNDEDALF